MKNANNTPAPCLPGAIASGSVATAKIRLMDWAEDCDARSRKARPSVGTIAAVGAIAVLGGVAFARVLSPRGRGAPSSGRSPGAGKQLLMGALALGARQWLLPYAMRAIGRYGFLKPSRPTHMESTSTPLASK